MKTFLLRLIRAITYLLQYFFLELPKGLDFSLRDKNSISFQGSHGYALTSKSALRNIFQYLPFSINDKNLIDIGSGSGKGGVICYAKQLGFKTCLGIEYEQHLHEIATKNIEKLNLHKSVFSLNLCARSFEHYDTYDVYFLFNPFDSDIYKQVINLITAQATNEKHLIAYGKANDDALVKYGFREIHRSTCPYRNNSIKIYEYKKVN
jgi:16S rRNA G966 N2-methylase RsmD